MRTHYVYPEELYCGHCGRDVKGRIIDCEASYEQDTGRILAVRYKASVCPVCGATLCERDQEYAFVAAAAEAMREEEAKKSDED